jgi:hypothetical protein
MLGVICSGPEAVSDAGTPTVLRMAAEPAGCQPRALSPLLAPLEIGYLTFCVSASNTIAVLNSANELLVPLNN